MKGAQILQNDITAAQGNGTFGVPLEKFAKNLSRLAILDKLGEDESPTCFAAISSIYSSLNKLYEHERQGADSSHGNIDSYVLRKKSGRPSMHERRRIGLSMDYWARRGSSANSEGPAKMSRVDDDMVTDEAPKDYANHADDNDVYSMTIECEQLPPGMYPPIRIPNGWISDQIEKSKDDLPDFDLMSGFRWSSATLDWLDPPVNQAASNQEDKVMDESPMIALTATPNARFVAKLAPPLAIPYHIATQLYASIQVNVAQVVFPDTASMADLILPSIQTGSVITDTKELHQMRSIGSAASAGPASDFQLGLYWSTPELGVVIESLPFDHPRRLVEALPVLRQYAFIARVLQKTFPTITKPSVQEPLSKQDIRKMRMKRYTAKFSNKDMETELAALLAPRTKSARALDVSLISTPVPQMTLSLASKQGLKKMTFNILPNADIEIVSQNIVPDDEDEVKKQKRVEGLKAALEISEDLGVWAVWVRKKYLEGDE